MRTYWDTSAAVNAALSPEVFRRLDRGECVSFHSGFHFQKVIFLGLTLPQIAINSLLNL